LARAGDPRVLPRTELGLAVSADGERWLLVGASCDLGQQVRRSGFLHPREGVRSSPIAAVLLLGAEIDQMAGVPALREGHDFVLAAPEAVLEALALNPALNFALDPDLIPRRVVVPGQPLELAGITIELFKTPGKPPLWDERARSMVSWGVELSEGTQRLVHVPSCTGLTPNLEQRLSGAATVVFDGTCWSDDELIAQGLSTKTSRTMGHQPIGGEDGSLKQLAQLGIGRLIFAPLNNSNPALIEDSAERRTIEAAGAVIAFDGMEILP
jgi:pyrroloquinoline quinone biosynthesis protein B